MTVQELNVRRETTTKAGENTSMAQISVRGDPRLMLAVVALMILGFVLDIFTPIGIPGCVVYLVPILLSAWFLDQRTMWVLAVIASVLTFLAIPLKPPGPYYFPAINRVITLLIVWLIVYIGMIWIRSENTYKESEERLHSILNNSTDILYRYDLKKEAFDFFSASSQRSVRHTTEELISSSFEQVLTEVYPDDRPSVRKAFGEVLKNGQGEVEYRQRRRDGTYGWVSNRATLTLDERGQPFHVYGSIRDISERKKAEDALKKAEERLRFHIENAPQAVIEWDSNFIVTRWAGEAERMFGLSANEAIGMPIMGLDLVYPEDIPLVERTIAKLTDGTNTKVISKNRNVTRDGRILYCTWYNTIFKGETGKMESVLSLVVDDTARTIAEEELKRSNTELQQFAYIASHDMQEPLRMVTSYIDLLDERFGSELNPKAKEYMAFAMGGANRMRDLINDLLAYSRVGSSKRSYGPVNMETVAERALRSLDPSITESGANIYIGPLPTIVADESQIEQVVQNLLSNAIKFRGGHKPTIKMNARKEVNEWIFNVEDNGIGINPQYVDRLFNMFQRLHTREEYPGTGIGLAISKKIVERHGGRIWVESEEGKGSTFYFSIPHRP